MIERLLANNLRSVAARNRADPAYFKRLADNPRAALFWIGCADAAIAAHELVGLDPGQVCVHRNLANLCSAHDVSFLASLQFALEVLATTDIVVCGHYGCAGVDQALTRGRPGIVDQWLEPLRAVAAREAGALDAIADAEARANELCARNVRAQVAAVADNPLVMAAWRRGQALSVHGWVYSSHDGLLRDLETSVHGPSGVPAPVAGAASAPRQAPRRRRSAGAR